MSLKLLYKLPSKPFFILNPRQTYDLRLLREG